MLWSGYFKKHNLYDLHLTGFREREREREKSPLIQMVLKLQNQTNMTNNIQHQDTEIFIHKIQPKQMIKTQKYNYLTYWNETTEKQSKSTTARQKTDDSCG